MRSLLIAALAVIVTAASTPALSQVSAPPPGAAAQGGRGPGMVLPTTRAEASERASERFARLDRNADGFISADELPTGPGGGGGRVPERLDSNGDGKLSPVEFEGQALAMFDRMDSDHDGRISPAEGNAWHARMRGREGPGGPPPQGE